MTTDEKAIQPSGSESSAPSMDKQAAHSRESGWQPYELESVGFEVADSKKLVRRIDWHLIPFLSLLYLLSFLDRSNIGNARIAGLERSLDMDPLGLHYATAVSVFFPWYVLAEIPSNLAMKRFRPSIWIPSLMVAWGVCCICMGFVTNYAGLLAVRMALGFSEGGLFPGVTYYITLWYRRHECGLRMAIFFSAATAAGAFGGILARGISEMDGLGGRPGWAWIFILEGILTLLVAFLAYWAMNDYPDTAKFLNVAERAEVLRRLKQDRSALDDQFRIKYFWHAFQDWKIWMNMFITIGTLTPLYSFSLFLPTIITGLDQAYADDPKKAQLMTVPPYVAACMVCIAGGYLADKRGKRGSFMIFFNLVAIVGFIMQISTTNNHVKYAGTFFAAMGIYPNVPQGVAWNGNNIGGSTKRGVGIAMQVGFGNLGGAIAGFLYRQRDRPMYHLGHGTLIAFEAMATILCLIMTIYLRRENARRDRAYKPPCEYTEEEKLLEREKGDQATFFRYTV